MRMLVDGSSQRCAGGVCAKPAKPAPTQRQTLQPHLEPRNGRSAVLAPKRHWRGSLGAWGEGWERRGGERGGMPCSYFLLSFFSFCVSSRSPEITAPNIAVSRECRLRAHDIAVCAPPETALHRPRNRPPTAPIAGTEVGSQFVGP